MNKHLITVIRLQNQNLLQPNDCRTLQCIPNLIGAPKLDISTLNEFSQ